MKLLEKASPSLRKAVLKKSYSELIHTVSECVLNVLRCNVLLTIHNKRRLLRHKNHKISRQKSIFKIQKLHYTKRRFPSNLHIGPDSSVPKNSWCSGIMKKLIALNPKVYEKLKKISQKLQPHLKIKPQIKTKLQTKLEPQIKNKTSRKNGASNKPEIITTQKIVFSDLDRQMQKIFKFRT